MNLRTFGDAFSTAPYIVKYHDMNRETFIARLTEVQQIVEQLLAQLQASEHDDSRITSTCSDRKT